jgi:hypothetical protein
MKLANQTFDDCIITNIASRMSAPHNLYYIYIEYVCRGKLETRYIEGPRITDSQILSVFENLVEHQQLNVENLEENFINVLRYYNKFTQEIQLYLKIL